MREITQPETAEWMGCTIEEMNAAHDQNHAELCKWVGVESQSLRVALGEILDAEETRLSWLEESAVLHVQRWLCSVERSLWGFISRQRRMNMFPFTIAAYDMPHFTISQYQFRSTFLKNKPEKMSWFAFDVIVNSPTAVEFVVYDMLDNVYGGVGKEIGRVEANVPPKLTRKPIEERAVRLAKVRRKQELVDAEDAIIRGYADELLSAALEDTAAAA